TSSSIPYPAASCSAARSSQLARLSSNQLCAVLMATPYAAAETWSTYFPGPRTGPVLPCPDEQIDEIRRRGGRRAERGAPVPPAGSARGGQADPRPRARGPHRRDRRG